MSWPTLVLSLLLPVPSLSGAELTPAILRESFDALGALNHYQALACFDPIARYNSLPACAEITDKFCSDLWSKENRGSRDVFDGRIREGTSVSGFRDSYLDDLKIFANSAAKLPPDLRAPLQPILEKLNAHLAAEERSKKWDRTLADLRREIERVFDDVRDARLAKSHPEMENINEEDYSIDQAVWAKAAGDQIRDEVLRAKYEQHPNWKRVERVFAQAQADLLQVVDGLKLPEDQRRLMRERVASVKLSLPFMGTELLGAAEACGTSERNAFYKPIYNKMTVCAGFFNRLQSNSILYGTIAHEIGHSIDADTLASHRCNHESPVRKALAPLDRAANPPYGCDDWAKVKASVLAAVPAAAAAPHPALDELYACLQSRKGMDDLTPERLEAAIRQLGRAEMAGYANDNDFLSLVVPSFNKFGKEVKNDTYFRPDVWYAKNYKYYKPDFFEANPSAVAILSQELSCHPGKEALSAMTESDRQKAFTEGLSTTRSLVSAKGRDQLAYCGKNCRELAPLGLGVNVGENFADWIAAKALKLRLSRLANSEERREASALFSADLCPEPGLFADVPQLAEAERQHSTRVHPDSRLRRLSVYNPENARLAGCRRDGDEKGFSSCDIK